MRTPTGELLTVERWKLFIAGSLHPHGSGFLNVVALAYFLARTTNLSSLLFHVCPWQLFSPPMIYTNFTQMRTGIIFWNFYQYRISLEWKEQSIGLPWSMDVLWLGRKKEVMWCMVFDDAITDMYETLFYFYLYLLMIINW